MLSAIDWDLLRDQCHADPDGSIFVELFCLTVLQVCCICSPKKLSDQKSVAPKSEHSRKRYVLNRKRRKLNSQLKSLKDRNPLSPKFKKIEEEINLIHFNIKEAHCAEQNYQEMCAVAKVLVNPEFFFSYAKKHSRVKCSVGPLNKNGTLTNNPSEMAELLQEQYVSVFSDPAAGKQLPHHDGSNASPKIGDISFSQAVIEEAIDDMNRDASLTDRDIPALILKECKNNISYPVFLTRKESCESEVIPEDMKIQSITPIFKKGDKSDPGNYRPISLTSHLIKIFERVIRKKLVCYLESNSILSNKQHGFRKGRSCLTHLLKHIDDIIQSLLNGNDHDVIYLDFAKAFDKVDHEILVHKLRQCGVQLVQGKLLKWIEQFLTNGKQFVTINGFHSMLALVLSGVPQGSVLGPILFLIYINDLHCHLKGCTAGSFADDTRLSKQISSCDDVLILQEDLNAVVKWATENNMVLHDSKFEYLAYRTASSKLLEELPYTAQWVHYSTPSGQDLTPASSVKDLGVHLSPDMKWSLQFTIAAQNANKMANWVLSVFSDRSKDVILTLYKSIVRSRLEYSCPVWNPSSMQGIKKLESTQRAFTRYISGCQGLSYWDRLKKLGLMSLQRRRERYVILHMWKIWQGAVPNYLDIQFYDHTRLGTRCKIPAIKRNSTTLSRSIYDPSFAVRGPKLWNAIPKNIKCAPSFEVFKSKLTSHFMSIIPDLPPVPGYTTPNSNSILD